MSRVALAAVAAGAVLVAPSVVRAEASFEAVAASASTVRRLDELIWAVTASCAAGDEIERRQCRLVRDARARTYEGATLLVEADPSALTVGAFSLAKKSVPLQVSACLACTPIVVDGTPWHVTGGVPQVVSGKVVTPRLYDNARPATSEAEARAWIAALGTWRVQMVVKLARTPTWQVGAARGVAVDIVGWRVIAPCSGEVPLSSQPSASLAPDPGACASTPPASR